MRTKEWEYNLMYKNYLWMSHVEINCEKIVEGVVSNIVLGCPEMRNEGHFDPSSEMVEACSRKNLFEAAPNAIFSISILSSKSSWYRVISWENPREKIIWLTNINKTSL